MDKLAGHVRLVRITRPHGDIDQPKGRGRRPQGVESPLEAEDAVQRLWPVSYRDREAAQKLALGEGQRVAEFTDTGRHSSVQGTDAGADHRIRRTCISQLRRNQYVEEMKSCADRWLGVGPLPQLACVPRPDPFKRNLEIEDLISRYSQEGRRNSGLKSRTDDGGMRLCLCSDCPCRRAGHDDVVVTQPDDIDAAIRNDARVEVTTLRFAHPEAIEVVLQARASGDLAVSRPHLDEAESREHLESVVAIRHGGLSGYRVSHAPLISRCYSGCTMTTSPIPKPLPVEMVPGIIYSPLAKRARVQGAGLEVWEIIRVYRLVDRDFERLRRSFDWLTSDQLRAALTFAERNPAFIAAEIAEAEATVEQLEDLWRRHPFTKPLHLRGAPPYFVGYLSD